MKGLNKTKKKEKTIKISQRSTKITLQETSTKVKFSIQNLTLSLPVTSWVGSYINLAMNQQIRKSGKSKQNFHHYMKDYTINFLMICRLTDFGHVTF